MLLPTVEELCDAAEHLRQDAVKKSTLKQLLWDKTVEWIKEHDWAQTKETPVGVKTHASSKSKKAKTTDWKPDALRRALDVYLDGEDDQTIEAHHFIESKLVEQFASGMPVDVVQHYYNENWNDQVQEIACDVHMKHLLVPVSLDALAHAMLRNVRVMLAVCGVVHAHVEHMHTEGLAPGMPFGSWNASILCGSGTRS